jgi:hypothetical protein
MSAIDTSADGAYIFLALENSSGQPVIARAARSDLSTWTKAYDPAAGTAGNVAKSVANADKMLFYGNFGTDVTVVLHTISTGANADISPPGLGAKVVNTLQVNPSGGSEAVITVDTDQDVKHTSNGGTTWTDWDAALGFDATALWVLWSGAYFAHRYFVAGDNGVDLDLLYSPNEGVSRQNKENASLEAQANICNVEATEA